LVRWRVTVSKMANSFSKSELLEQLQKIDEYEFEKFVADLWKEYDWSAHVTSSSGDKGVDIIAKKAQPFQQKVLIQAKRYSNQNKVGSPEIQQYASLYEQEDDVDSVIVVTTSSFSAQAQQLADSLSVKLIDGPSLCRTINDLPSEKIVWDYLQKVNPFSDECPLCGRNESFSKTISDNRFIYSCKVCDRKWVPVGSAGKERYKLEGTSNKYSKTADEWRSTES